MGRSSILDEMPLVTSNTAHFARVPQLRLVVVAGEILGVGLAWIAMSRRFKRRTDRYGSLTVPSRCAPSEPPPGPRAVLP